MGYHYSRVAILAVALVAISTTAYAEALDWVLRGWVHGLPVYGEATVDLDHETWELQLWHEPDAGPSIATLSLQGDVEKRSKNCWLFTTSYAAAVTTLCQNPSTKQWTQIGSTIHMDLQDIRTKGRDTPVRGAPREGRMTLPKAVVVDQAKGPPQ